MRVLLAEDDKNLGNALKQGLIQHGFQVDWVRDGEAVSYEIKNTNYTALILDIGLPFRDGFSVLKEIRSDGIQLPVLLLTAQDGVDSITQGLDLGGDDYVVKPVALEVLAARLRAIIRRSEGVSKNEIKVGRLMLNPLSYQAQLDGQELDLSKKEFSLLHALILSSNRVLTKTQLEDQLYSWGHEVESNALEVHIHNLRKKIGSDLIQTIRGVGYQFRG
ncbi:winged helix-turn-helix domain-containing protein [Polynucleobacter necessarius]|uniref:winged helix-turn-helix domain-containing protein n=1 Tax=Polynucleobacter necessarius TaxID=576610 RepID=UPI000E0996CE|nr:response regulator transcription factor [Polynucleobacter necessarius]